MRLSCVAVIDRSGMFKGRRSSILDVIVRAIQIQVERDYCPAWGRVPVPVLAVRDGDPVPIGSGLVYLVDRMTDVQGAVGFHKADPSGYFSGSVAVESIARLGGTMATGPDSVSSALSHEVLEILQNPGVNYWVDRGDGSSVAMEICDPVSSDCYEIEVEPLSGGDLSSVSVSNFVRPDWFHPFATSGGWFDQMQLLSEAFSTRAGGYVSLRTGREMTQSFGPKVPQTKRQRVESAGRCVRARDAMMADSVVVCQPEADSEVL